MSAAPRIGITGTQGGTTADQRAALVAVLVGLQPAALHHGDGIGGDADAHRLTREHLPATRIVIHPPANPEKQACCRGDAAHRPAPYLERNQHLVDATDRLVALPGGPELARSGTWYTVRYAARQGRPITIIWPDGSVEECAPTHRGADYAPPIRAADHAG